MSPSCSPGVHTPTGLRAQYPQTRKDLGGSAAAPTAPLAALTSLVAAHLGCEQGEATAAAGGGLTLGEQTLGAGLSLSSRGQAGQWEPA